MENGMIEIDKLIGTRARKIQNLISRKVENYAATLGDMPVSGPNLFILAYLKENRDRDIFQRDLEKVLSVTKSTCSKVLTVMEAKNLVMRSSVKDARFNKVTVTQKGIEIVGKFDKYISDLDKEMTAGLSDEQLKTLSDCMDVIEANLNK